MNQVDAVNVTIRIQIRRINAIIVTDYIDKTQCGRAVFTDIDMAMQYAASLARKAADDFAKGVVRDQDPV